MSTPAPQPAGRSNDILWAAVGLLGVAAMGYFYVLPSVTSLKDARATVKAKEQDNQEVQDQITQVTRIGAQLASQQTALQQLGLAVPSGAAFDQLLIALSAIASSSGVELSSVQPVAVTASGAATQGASATISLKGSYSGVHLFLENLAKNIRPVTIANLAIASSADEKNVSLLTVTMTLTAAQAAVPAAAEQAVQ